MVARWLSAELARLSAAPARGFAAPWCRAGTWPSPEFLSRRRAGCRIADMRRAGRGCQNAASCRLGYPRAPPSRIRKRVPCRATTNPDADAKRLAPPLLRVAAANGSAGTDECRRALKLLHRQKPQRVAHDDADARACVHSVTVAAQATKRERERREPEVRFRLPAASGEPREVDEAAVGARLVSDAEDVQQDEPHLEWAPSAIVGPAQLAAAPSTAPLFRLSNT